MRIVLLLNSLAPGGTERSSIVLAQQMLELGIDTTIVTLRKAPHDLEDDALAAGIRVTRLPRGTPVRQAIGLRRLLREIRPDVLHTALFDADIVGRLASWRTGVRVVSSFVNTPYDEARSADPRVSRWKLTTVRLIDSVTARRLVHTFHAVSAGTASANVRALRIPIDRVVVAERGRDLPTVGPADDETSEAVRMELGIPSQQRIVLNVGRQEHQKAQVDLVRAMPLVEGAGLDVVLLVAGRPGNATQALDDVVRTLDTGSNSVKILGHRSDIHRLLAAADVLVISSRYEGTAGVAIEAMAAGTPIVSTAVEGVEGVLEHGGNALLVRVGDAGSLAEGIVSVLSDADLAQRLVKRAHEDWLHRFTARASAERMLDLYRSTLRSPAPAGRSTWGRRPRS